MFGRRAARKAGDWLASRRKYTRRWKCLLMAIFKFNLNDQGFNDLNDVQILIDVLDICFC